MECLELARRTCVLQASHPALVLMSPSPWPPAALVSEGFAFSDSAGSGLGVGGREVCFHFLSLHQC